MIAGLERKRPKPDDHAENAHHAHHVTLNNHHE